MRFHVLGIGPVGSFLAHHLRIVVPSIHPISLIHKNRSQAAIFAAQGNSITVENDGISVPAHGFESEVFETTQTRMFERASTRKPSPPHKNRAPGSGRRLYGPFEPSDTIESLFITTKAYSTLGAVRRLLPRLSAHSTIVLLQNGMGVYEEL